MRVYDDVLGGHGLVGGQVLLAPLDFVHRKQYLHARQTLLRLLELGVVPVVNENDAIADDEIRFGDNDRLAALVAHLVGAELLVLLTDTPGLLTADPRLDDAASLIEEIVEVDHSLEAMAGGSAQSRGSGGMASKLAAAKIAAWSGVRVVIAGADRPGVLADAAAGVARRRHRRAAPRPPAVGPQAVDRLRGRLERHRRRRRRRPDGAGRAADVAAAGRRGRRARRLRRRRRGGDRRARRAGVRQGPGPPPGRPGQGVGRPADLDAAGRPAPRGRPPRRPGRAAVTRPPRMRGLLAAGAGLSVLVLLAGCGLIQASRDTAAAVDRAGFHSARVNVNDSGGFETVTVSAAVDGPAGSSDGERAAQVVWRTFKYRIDELDVDITGSGADYTTSFTTDDLVSMFGPRDPSFDKHTVTSTLASAGKAVAIVVGVGGLLFLIFIVVVVVLVVRSSRRRRVAAPPARWGPPASPWGAPPAGWGQPPPGYGAAAARGTGRRRPGMGRRPRGMGGPGGALRRPRGMGRRPGRALRRPRGMGRRPGRALRRPGVWAAARVGRSAGHPGSIPAG